MSCASAPAAVLVSATALLLVAAVTPSPADTPAQPEASKAQEQPQPPDATDAPAPPATTQPKQPDDPAQRSTAPARGLFDFERFSFDLGLEGRYDRRRVRQDVSRWSAPDWRQTNRSAGLEETLGLRAAGTVFDERILSFDLSGRAGLEQEWFSESAPGRDLSHSPDGALFEYDAHLTLLPRGMISANAFATRQDSRLPRMFQPSLDRTLERYGAELLINHRTFPTRLSFEHLWDELDSRTGGLRDQEQRGHEAFRYEGTWQPSERQALDVQYEYEDRRERYSGTPTRFDTTRNCLTLDHTLRFGLDGRSVWETLARFQDETGELARDLAEASTLLRLQHTDRFSSNYRAQFLRESYAELTTRTWRGEAGLTCQLDQTFSGAVQLYGLGQSANEGSDFAEWGGLASAAYNRPNCLGRFSANVSYNHASSRTQSGTQRGVVIGESLTFRDPLLAFLAQPNVDPLTIVVTDVGRRRTYLPGRDYRVVPLGRYTALQRVPNGQIADRQSVLVSYTYRLDSDYDVSRDRLDLRVQQDFNNGLRPYYAASLQDEDIDQSGHGRLVFRGFEARRVNRHRVGLSCRQRRWSASLEYELNDETIDPYQAAHLGLDAALWQSARAQLDSRAMLSQFWFDGTDELPARDTTLLDLGLSWRCLLARDLEASASANYRWEDDSSWGVTHGVDLTAALEWNIGYFSLRFEAEYDLLRLPGSRDDGVAVWLKLRREIPLISGERS